MTRNEILVMNYFRDALVEINRHRIRKGQPAMQLVERRFTEIMRDSDVDFPPQLSRALKRLVKSGVIVHTGGKGGKYVYQQGLDPQSVTRAEEPED